MLIRRMTLSGLAVMGTVALCSAIWPAVAVVVADVFVSVLAGSMAVPAAVGVRLVRSELGRRRELRLMPAVEVTASGSKPVVPTLAELRESA